MSGRIVKHGVPGGVGAVAMALALTVSTGHSAPVATQAFAALPTATGAGPHELAGGWALYGFDANDPQTVFAAAEGGGVLVQRGTPWGLPGGLVAYTGEGAQRVRTVRSTLELRGGSGDNGGRVTWLAAFVPGPRQQPALALCWDTAGTNGASIGAGGPGDYAGKALRAGLKLVGPLVPEGLVTFSDGLGWPTLWLCADQPPLGHVVESVLSYDPDTGRAAARVYDSTGGELIYEGTFQLKPTAQRLIPQVGGYNGFAGWASDKGFALRVGAVSLDDAFMPQGRELPDPREGVGAGRFPSRAGFPELNQFLGANNLGGPLWHEYGLGWCRSDFSWETIEPENDVFTWRRYDHMVQEVHSHGIEVLPMLGYTARWAASKEGDGFSAPRRVADWEDFVERVVARYSRPPFSLRYFQVWNEPTWEPLSFWHGTGPEWVDGVFIPAARIIRRYDCQVVFGGWPVADVAHLFDVLEYHEAWRWTDILDVHYCENSTLRELHERYIKTGKCRGIWQTEIGYHSFAGYLPNCYLRFLHFGLRTGWSFPDQYKLFWYAFWGAGDDAPRCLTGPGEQGNNTPSEHGRRLQVMNEVLGGGTLRAFTEFQVTPELQPEIAEESPTALGFRVGRERIVIALLFDEPTWNAHPEAALRIAASRQPSKVELVTSVGARRDLACEWSAEVCSVRVPMREVPLEVARGWGREWKVALAYVLVSGVE